MSRRSFLMVRFNVSEHFVTAAKVQKTNRHCKIKFVRDFFPYFYFKDMTEFLSDQYIFAGIK